MPFCAFTRWVRNGPIIGSVLVGLHSCRNTMAGANDASSARCVLSDPWWQFQAMRRSEDIRGEVISKPLADARHFVIQSIGGKARQMVDDVVRTECPGLLVYDATAARHLNVPLQPRRPVSTRQTPLSNRKSLVWQILPNVPCPRQRRTPAVGEPRESAEVALVPLLRLQKPLHGFRSVVILATSQANGQRMTRPVMCTQ